MIKKQKPYFVNLKAFLIKLKYAAKIHTDSCRQKQQVCNTKKRAEIFRIGALILKSQFKDFFKASRIFIHRKHLFQAQLSFQNTHSMIKTERHGGIMRYATGNT